MSRTRTGFDIYRVVNLRHGDKIQTKSSLCIGGYESMPDATDAVTKLYQIQANHKPYVSAAYNIQPCKHVIETDNWRQNRNDDAINDKHRATNDINELINTFFGV